MEEFTPTSLSSMPRGVAAYRDSAEAVGRETGSSTHRIGSIDLLNEVAGGNSIVLDYSAQSISDLDALISRLNRRMRRDLCPEIAFYLGDTLCQLSPEAIWWIDGHGYPKVRLTKSEDWDVVNFVFGLSESTGISLRDGLDEMMWRVSR